MDTRPESISSLEQLSAPGDKPRCALVDIDLGKVEARLLAAYLSDPEGFHDAMFDTFA